MWQVDLRLRTALWLALSLFIAFLLWRIDTLEEENASLLARNASIKAERESLKGALEFQSGEILRLEVESKEAQKRLEVAKKEREEKYKDFFTSHESKASAASRERIRPLQPPKVTAPRGVEPTTKVFRESERVKTTSAKESKKEQNECEKERQSLQDALELFYSRNH